jgi:hypothetical protein
MASKVDSKMGFVDFARSYLGSRDDFRLGIDASVRLYIEVSVYRLPNWSQRRPDRWWSDMSCD